MKSLKDMSFSEIYNGMAVNFRYGKALIPGRVLSKKTASVSLIIDDDGNITKSTPEDMILLDIEDGPFMTCPHRNCDSIYFSERDLLH